MIIAIILHHENFHQASAMRSDCKQACVTIAD